MPLPLFPVRCTYVLCHLATFTILREHFFGYYADKWLICPKSDSERRSRRALFLCTCRSEKMEANIITLGRIMLVFITVAMFQIDSVYVHAAGTFLIAFVIYLDQLDGYVARKLNVASDFGALFDIVGDRIVESIFWIYFAAQGMISFWAPMIIITRGFLADSVRAQAFKQGKTPFGEKTMMKSPTTKFLVASRFSRGFYGGLKAVLFTFLGLSIFMASAEAAWHWSYPPGFWGWMHIAEDILVYMTVIMCIIRGLPVLWDGKAVLFEKVYPRTFHVIDTKISNI